MKINNKLIIFNFLNVINYCSDCWLLPKKYFFYKWLWKLYIFLNIKKNFNLVLVNKDYMYYLNNKFRNKNSFTDILSFPFNFSIKNLKFNCLGDIIICPLVILENSIRININYFFYFSYLIIHGLLHILGFNHYKYLDYKFMRNFEFFFLFKIKKIYFYENLLINRNYE